MYSRTVGGRLCKLCTGLCKLCKLCTYYTKSTLTTKLVNMRSVLYCSERESTPRTNSQYGVRTRARTSAINCTYRTYYVRTYVRTYVQPEHYEYAVEGCDNFTSHPQTNQLYICGCCPRVSSPRGLILAQARLRRSTSTSMHGRKKQCKIAANQRWRARAGQSTINAKPRAAD